MLELNRDNFLETARRPGINLVYCWSPVCGSCRQFTPVFERASARHGMHNFAKLDIQAEEKLAGELGISHVPALMVFRDGAAVFCRAGNFSEAALADIIDRARSFDIDKGTEEAADGPEGGSRESN